MLLHLLFIFLSCSLFAKDPKTIFITSEGKPTEELIQLLRLDGLYDEKDDLAQIVQKTQKKWLSVHRGAHNIERVDLKDSADQQKQRDEVEKIAWKMGLFDPQIPSRTHYEYAICPGAFLEGVRFRLAELVKLWQQGVSFDSLYFLCGERPLRKGNGEMDGLDKLTDPKASPLPFKPDWKMPANAPYETEHDMVKLLWQQVALPEEMAKSLEGKVYFINTPRGEHLRPSTKENYETWLKEVHPPPGHIVAASHPLYWAHQKLTAQNVLGPEFSLDISSPQMSQDELTKKSGSIVSLVHDTVAKCLFEMLL